MLRTAIATDDMLTPGTVRSIYAAAAARPPLCERPAVAAMFAELYAETSTSSGAVMVIASMAGEDVGFAFGHSWNWATVTDPWGLELKSKLGPRAAELIDRSFALELMAVSPHAGGVGLGRALLTGVLAASSHTRAWLQTTDIDSPARRLYLSAGWRQLGHGPDAPDKRPGLVLTWQADDD